MKKFIRIGSNIYTITRENDGSITIENPDTTTTYQPKLLEYDTHNGSIIFTVGNVTHHVIINRTAHALSVYTRHACLQLIEIDTKKLTESAKHDPSSLYSPLAGKVLATHVTQDQFVKKDDCLLTIESMKMENEIRATQDAFIKNVSITPGDVVQPNQLLITFETQQKG